MTLQDIILQSADLKSLQAEIGEKKIAQAIMLISKDEVYTFEFAKMLASVLFNDGKILDNESHRKVTMLSHPDLKIYPQKAKLLVADSDNIVEENSIKPVFDDKKIFILKNIESATEQAQNKLLKTLEEPSENTYFILTTSNPALVLPTIKSRCNKVELGKISQRNIEALIGGNENSSLIGALCEGQAGRALALSEKENLREIFKVVVETVAKMQKSSQVLIYSKKILDLKENMSFILEIMELIFEDLLFIKAGKEKCLRLKEEVQTFKNIEGDYTIKAIGEIRALLDEANKKLVMGANVSLVLENLLLNILEVKYLCK